MHCNGGTPLRTPTVTKTKPLFNHMMICIIRRWSVCGQTESADKFCDPLDVFILDKECNVDIKGKFHFTLSISISKTNIEFGCLPGSVYSSCLHNLEYVENTFLGNVLIRDLRYVAIQMLIFCVHLSPNFTLLSKFTVSSHDSNIVTSNIAATYPPKLWMHTSFELKSFQIQSV